MSLRARIAVVVVLAALALGASALAITRVLATTARARAEAAWARSGAAAVELARALPESLLVPSAGPGPPPGGPQHQSADGPPPPPPGGPPRPDALELAPAHPPPPPPGAAPVPVSELPPAVRSLGMGDAGFCTDGGQLLGSIGLGPPGRIQRRQPPPEARRTLLATCASLGGQERAERLVEVAGMQGALTVVRSPREHVLAWAMAAIARPPDEAVEWRMPVVVLVASSGALIVVCLSALWALRRGIGQLQTSLRRLEVDLGAQVDLPRATELAGVGQGIVELARHLGQARERELVLQRRVESDRRLSALGRITAGIAHEVRNPLATLKLRLQLLDGAAEPAARHPEVQAAIEDVDRADAVVRSLLTVASTNAVLPQRLDLGPWVDARLKRLAHLGKERSLRLVRQGEASALVDPDALERVLENLLTNALQAAPDGTTVTVALAESDGGATLTVRDLGPGAPAEHATELFEPFFTTRRGGTGLGLWLSRSLVEAQGGSIEYHHDARGTELRVQLARAGG
jgi:signal transduction histidine kinase